MRRHGPANGRPPKKPTKNTYSSKKGKQATEKANEGSREKEAKGLTSYCWQGNVCTSQQGREGVNEKGDVMDMVMIWMK